MCLMVMYGRQTYKSGLHIRSIPQTHVSGQQTTRLSDRAKTDGSLKDQTEQALRSRSVVLTTKNPFAADIWIDLRAKHRSAGF